MKRTALTLIALSSLAGCYTPLPSPSPEPAPVVQRPVVSTLPASASLAPAPVALAPLDQWRAGLALALPSPWRFESIEAQVVAPRGWTRVSGDRGLAVWITDGTSRQVFWIMTSEFKGNAFQPRVLAKPIAEANGFRLYAPRRFVPGWTATHTDAVVVGLSFGEGLANLTHERTRKKTHDGMAAVVDALAAFKADLGVYPKGLASLWRRPRAAKGWKGPYLGQGRRMDAWGGHYLFTSTWDRFELTSLGADGLHGGAGDDEDMTFE